MSLMQDDHVVKAVAADIPDQPLDVRILPWTPRGDHDFLDPHVAHALPKRGPVNAVAIAQEIPRGLVPREGINDLISWMSARTSRATAGRPGLPCWLSCRQKSRKRWRCQAITVPGWTNARASHQPGHSRDSHAQNRLGRVKSRAMDRLLVDRQLMPQCQVFQAQGCPRPKEAHNQGQQRRDDGEHDQKPPHKAVSQDGGLR